jgi:NADH-quinone oxidoreductase subunit G
MDGRVKRVVPQACDSLNETWISDRDRFSYEGLYADDRLRQPMIRDDGGWRVASWEQALDAAARGLREAGQSSGALVSPSATTEEGFLLARLMDHLGSPNIDHRLRRRDFRAQDGDPLYPSLGCEIAAIDELEQVLIVGSNLRREVPLLAHRVRKAALRGAGVRFVNPAAYPYLFPVAGYAVGTPRDFWLEIATLLRAAGAGRKDLPDGAAAILERAGKPDDSHRQWVSALRSAARSAIFLGHISQRHSDLALIESLAGALARRTGSALGYISEGANSAGLALAGVLPHRTAGGASRAAAGATARDMTRRTPRAMVLFGIEPEADCADGMQALDGLGKADFVAAVTPFVTANLERIANVLLPLATFTETAGTFVNAEGRWQSFEAVSRPVGEARPGWKILRVLGNRLGVPNFEYSGSQAIRDELRDALGDVRADNLGVRPVAPPVAEEADSGLAALDVPMYRTDALVRRATALQLTQDGQVAGEAAAQRRRA